MPPAPAALPVPPLPEDKVDLLARLTEGLDAHIATSRPDWHRCP